MRLTATTLKLWGVLAAYKTPTQYPNVPSSSPALEPLLRIILPLSLPSAPATSPPSTDWDHPR